MLSATLLAKADAPRAGATLWGGAVLVSAGVIAFATSPPAMKERRPSRKAHVSDPIPEEAKIMVRTLYGTGGKKGKKGTSQADAQATSCRGGVSRSSSSSSDDDSFDGVLTA